MYTRWTSHLKDETEIKNFKQRVLAAKPILDRLKDLMNDVETGMDRLDRDPRSFDNPNWAYKQAFNNGYRAALGSLKTMVDLDQQRNNDDH